MSNHHSGAMPLDISACFIVLYVLITIPNDKSGFNSNAVMTGPGHRYSRDGAGGERATIFIPSVQAYGVAVRAIPQSSLSQLIEQFVIPGYAARVTPYEVLVFDVTLQIVH